MSKASFSIKDAVERKRTLLLAKSAPRMHKTNNRFPFDRSVD
jgi:hypothetical protein